MNIQPYLVDLEARLDAAQEERVEREWLCFADLKLTTGAFRTSRLPCPAKIEWKPMLVNDALDDVTCMIYQQLYSVHQALENGGGEMLCLRSNYGTSIIPSMFGVEPFIMPRQTNTLPGSRPFTDGRQGIARMLTSKTAPDYTRGFAGKVFSMAETYLEQVRDYPKVSRYVHYYNPDLQGPLALCEVLWGSGFYEDFYDDTDVLEDALDFFTDLYLDFTRRWHTLCPTFDKTHSVEWGCMHRGGTIIRNDSAMNISGTMYEEYVMPRDQKIIDAVGGGIHFCGKGDHYIQHVTAIKGLTCINMSEPARNDMEVIYRNTVDRGVIIFGLVNEEVERALQAGRPLHGRVSAGASVAAWLGKRD